MGLREVERWGVGFGFVGVEDRRKLKSPIDEMGLREVERRG